MHIKRGTKVTYQFAAGKIVPGVVVKRHKDMMDGEWHVVKMTDEAGTFTGSCHSSQIVVTDNRPNRLEA